MRVVPVLLVLTAACAQQPAQTAPIPAAGPMHTIIPIPVSAQIDTTQRFVVDTLTTVQVAADADSAVTGIARYVRSMLAPFVRSDVVRGDAAGRSIRLRLNPGSAALGDEGYELNVSPDSAVITAGTAAGLFHGVQTLRQLLPVSVEHTAAIGRRLWIPAARVTDTPRFGWRGMMLDVSRHFLPARDVKRFIDNMALYKLNRLHLHLGDDQGWRVEIQSRPQLTAIGGSTQVGGGPGGFYTQDEYKDIVAYAASRFITVIPEIDMPGHTNAALASIPELNCDGIARSLYTGTRVGFSAVCVDSARIYPILDDVVREISGMTPGPWFHIGGDEVRTLGHDKFKMFVERMQSIVNAHGKQMIGWSEIAPANLSPATIVQNWIKDSSAVHVARGGKVILSPATKVYLDMKYDSSTVLGLTWAGITSLMKTYDWDPATFIEGVPESSILGIEAPLWSETVQKVQDYEFMAFPRLIAVAELGWSSAARRSWEGFSARLQHHEPRLDALGINWRR